MLGKIILLVSVIAIGYLAYWINYSKSTSYTFGVTKEFCKTHFNGNIAMKGKAFNYTDAIENKRPMRRLIGEFVTSSKAYIWYEHGGFAPHQHLVQYHIAKPQKIIANYSFHESEVRHSNISDLIEDSKFLISNKATDIDEL